MEQYKKSGPIVERPTTDTTAHDVSRLQQLIKDQGDQIRHLDKEVTRLKTKLDAHAATINLIKRG